MKFKEKYRSCKNWKTQARCVYFFHILMKSRKKKWLIADTARYFSISSGNVSESLSIVENKKLVQSAKSRNQALKIIRGIQL